MYIPFGPGLDLRLLTDGQLGKAWRESLTAVASRLEPSIDGDELIGGQATDR